MAPTLRDDKDFGTSRSQLQKKLHPSKPLRKSEKRHVRSGVNRVVLTVHWPLPVFPAKQAF
jgi:hypothetical protein